MRNGGCVGLLVALIVVAMVLLAVKWFGIPVGLALTAISYAQFKRFGSDPEGFKETARSLDMRPEPLRQLCIAGMIAGGVLIGSSAILWIVSAEKSETTSTGDTSDGPVPVAFRGTWAFSSDCNNPYSQMTVRHDSVSFPGGVGFAVDRATGSETRTVLQGDALDASGSMRDATIQSDQMTLTLGDGGKTMTVDTARSTAMNGERLTRCPD